MKEILNDIIYGASVFTLAYAISVAALTTAFYVHDRYRYVREKYDANPDDANPDDANPDDTNPDKAGGASHGQCHKRHTNDDICDCNTSKDEDEDEDGNAGADGSKYDLLTAIRDIY